MKFDVVIGNPPYQKEANTDREEGKAVTYKAAYTDFIEMAIKAGNFVSMIVPAKWYADKQTALARVRHILKDEGHLEVLVDYKNSLQCFENVRVVGGICYFAYNKKYTGDCRIVNVSENGRVEAVRDIVQGEYIVRDNIGVQILQKVQSKTTNYLSQYVEASFFDIKDNSKGVSKRNNESDYEILSSDHNAMAIKYIDYESVLKNRVTADDD